MRQSYTYRVFIGDVHVGDSVMDFEDLNACQAKGFLIPTAAYDRFRMECAKTFYSGQAHLRISIVREDGETPVAGTIVEIADPSLEAGVDPDEIEVHVTTPTHDDIRKFCPFFK